MRTTIRIDDGVLAAAKARAAETGTTLSAVVEEALRAALARREAAEAAAPVRLKTVGGRGLRPGVVIDDSATLLDLLDRSDDPM